ncbi:hypothetical protein [uncultured Leuconostoc sp.]|uniref:hypothetical protein n=1 Tax=uncultured Leuconostoc sp. TaxID=173262 RepID=UPI0025980313|nr:hypothetical protein [uncultured Leuconostoc sp.]
MMTETVVHVTTLEQWKSVLDVWFEHGYSWYSGDKEYHGGYFNLGSRYLFLTKGNDIIQSSSDDGEPYIEYSEFISKKKEDNKMATYYVTQEQLNLIEKANRTPYPLKNITSRVNLQKDFDEMCFETTELQKAILRYLGGDETIEFKLKEQLYRLWRIDDDGDKVYMRFNLGTPTWFENSTLAFTAPLEEIKKWQTPAWSVEEVD